MVVVVKIVTQFEIRNIKEIKKELPEKLL